MFDQFQQSLPGIKFTNQSKKSNQTSHETKNGLEIIFYKLIHKIAFEAFYVFDALVASVAPVAFAQQHQLIDIAI